MENISEMIERMCPEGVEWKTLGEFANINTGNKPVEILTQSIYKYINAGTTESGYCDEFNTEGDTVTTPSRGQGGIGFVGYQTLPFWCGPLCYRIKSDGVCLNKFLYYYLSCHNDLILQYKCEGGTPALNRKDLSTLLLPLPPLPIQQEIVRFLDSFTQLQSNLEAELAARQKQYEYYRDSLFGEDLDTLLARTDCDVKTIGELGTLTRGKRFVRTDIVEQGVPCIHYGDMYTYYGLKAETANTHITDEKAKSMRFAKKGDVVIVGAGENDWDIGVGLVWLGEDPAAIHDACYILEHSQDPVYISHFMRSTVYHLQLRKYVSSGKISSFAAKDLAKIYIPVPSLNRQHEIVSILDTFEALIANIKQEIEARKKQYEYYREQLLTFE